MALLDRVAGTLPSTNSLEPLRKPQTPINGAPADPEAVTRAYYIEDRGQERRYYEDYKRQSLAMRADPDRISSRREDLPTIRAMLAVAEIRGWAEVKVTGSAEFRREAWIEAQARGLTVQGYNPSEPERQEAERRRAERSRGTGAPADNHARDKTTPEPQALHRAKLTDTAGGGRQEQRATPETALSPDGRLVLAALSSKIDRQMAKLNAEAKSELKAFAAAELAKKERAEGPVVLSAAQRELARAPHPAHLPSTSRPEPQRIDIEPQRRARGR